MKSTTDTCPVCFSEELKPPPDWVYTEFAVYLSVVILVVIWTVYHYITLYYGRTTVNNLTFRPFLWASYTMAIKFLSALYVFIRLPFFTCLVTKCQDFQWRETMPYQLIRLL